MIHVSIPRRIPVRVLDSHTLADSDGGRPSVGLGPLDSMMRKQTMRATLALLTIFCVLGLTISYADDSKKKPAEKKKFYDPIVRQIEGWTIKIDPQLLSDENEETSSLALEAHANHLQRIKYITPKKQLAQLRKLPIWIELDNAELGNMQYHPSRGWLVKNGHDPRLVKHVHIPRADALFNPRSWQKHPYVILHELAHSYHDQVLGFNNPEIVAEYKNMKEKGIYEATSTIYRFVSQEGPAHVAAVFAPPLSGN